MISSTNSSSSRKLEWKVYRGEVCKKGMSRWWKEKTLRVKGCESSFFFVIQYTPHLEKLENCIGGGL
jgi:hypothetical protein